MWLYGSVLSQMLITNLCRIYVLLASPYLFKSIACNSLEGLLHIDCFLGAGFKIWDVVLALAPSLCSLGCYLKHKGDDDVINNWQKTDFFGVFFFISVIFILNKWLCPQKVLTTSPTFAGEIKDKSLR